MKLSKGTNALARILIATLIIFSLTLSIYFAFFRAEQSTPIHSSETVLLYFLVNFNIVTLFVLLLLIGRNIAKLIFESRQNILGAKLKLKLVAAFVGLALVPTMIVVILASGLLSDALQGWLRSRIETGVASSVAISRRYFSELRDKVEQTTVESIKGLDSLNKDALQSSIESIRRANRLFSIKIFNNAALEIATAQNAAATIETFREPVIDKEAFNKVISAHQLVNNAEFEGAQRFIRIYIPQSIAGGENTVLVATYRVDPEITEHFSTVNDALADYEQLKRVKAPLKAGYFLTLSLITTVILFAALWLSFYIARQIVDPVEKLVKATYAVAEGKYDVEVLNTSKDELGILVESFNRMVRELRESKEINAQAQSMAAWREVARRIAHEIKNPLTPIQLSSQRLKKLVADNFESTQLTEQLKESADTIVENVHSIKRLADEFSRFARMPTAQLSATKVDSLIYEQVSNFADQYPDIVFQSIVDGDLPEIHLDKEQFRRALINIVDNAAAALQSDKSNNEALSIKIKATYDIKGDQLKVEIADNGPGVPQQLKTQIFEPYFTTKESGTGLGLAIVTSILLDHHGKVRVFDNYPRGARFVLEIPRVPPFGTA